MKKKLTVVMCLVLIISMMTGCTTFNNFKNAFFGTQQPGKEAAERTIKIGVFEPLSGQNKEQGNLELMGIELANQLYPEVLGKKVELVLADNQSDMYVAETVINELAAQKPSVILGSYGETLTLVASDTIKANNIPAITITSTNPLITVNNAFYFCATYSESKQGDALADFVYTNKKLDKVATVKITGDDTATANIQRFNNRIKVLAGNSESVVGNYQIDNASKDYTETLEKIKKSEAKAVFLDVAPATAEEFLKQADTANMTNILYVGPKTWDDEKFLKYITDNRKLSIGFAADYSAKSSTTAMSEEFVKAYKYKYGQDAEPAQATAVAFDAYVMALKSIEKAYNNTMAWDVEALVKAAPTEAEGKAIKEDFENTKKTGIPTGKAIRDAIKSIDGFEGASGIISYRGNNEATKSIEVVYYDKGKAVQKTHTVDKEKIEGE